MEALTTLVGRYPDKKITIVWDNARWHRSKKLRDHLGEGNPLANVHLVWDRRMRRIIIRLRRYGMRRKQRSVTDRGLVFEDTCIGFETFIGSSVFPTGYELVGEAFDLGELYY